MFRSSFRVQYHTLYNIVRVFGENMSSLSLDRQQQRLRFIDLCAYILGYVNRNLLMTRFDIKEVTASKDIKAYQEMTNNLTYMISAKVYQPVGWFAPLYSHDIHDALLLLTDNKQEVSCSENCKMPAYVLNVPVNKSELAKVSSVLRALAQPSVVEIEYYSRTNGHSVRSIVPHTLIQMGGFCYVRAYDRLKKEFRTFKLNRILNSTQLPSHTFDKECKAFDQEWEQEVDVVIVPNGDEQLDTLTIDYQLTNGELLVRLKKPVLKYFLMGWNIVPLEFENLPYALFPLKVKEICEV